MPNTMTNYKSSAFLVERLQYQQKFERAEETRRRK